MTDKEKIIAEIERLKVEIPYHENAWSVLNKLEGFINYLSVEHQNEDLDIETNLEYKSNYKLKELTLDEFRTIVHHFTNWQKEQMMKDAINGIMDCDDDNEWIEITDKLIVTPSRAGKRVKIIIIKEDEQ